MKLLELYKALLRTANLVVTDDGFISNKFHLTDEATPAMIKGKRLVMPTAAHLSNPKPSEQIIFHPLSENMMREESVVLESFRGGINNRLQFTVGVLCLDLLTIATSTAEHSKLSPDQSEFLSKVKNADDKTLDIFKKVLSKMATDPQQNSFVNIYLKRGGTVGGKKFHRVGIVNFPFYNELKKTDDLYGIKLRVKDRETFINLMEYIFPAIEVAEAYNQGTNSKIAPFIDALMKSVIAIASPINDLISLFKNVIDDADQLMIEDSWVDTFDNLEVMIPEIRLIPMQAGNEGSHANVPAATAQQQVMAAPPALPVQLQTNVVQQPFNGYQNNPYPQNNFVQPPAPGFVKTAGGLDFASLERSIPALHNANMNYQQYQSPGDVRNNAQPRWAQPQFQQPQQNFGNQFQYGNQQFPQQQPQFGNPQFPLGRI